MANALWIYSAIALLILLLDAWAITSVMKSDRSGSSKGQWAVLILVLPLLGLIIWGINGPRGVAIAPTSAEHSKG